MITDAQSPAGATLADRAQAFVRDIMTAPLEPVLQRSDLRLRVYGIFITIGHPFYGFLWSYIYPDDWESIALRFAVGSTGLPYALGWLHARTRPQLLSVAFVVTTWLQFPALYSWYYLVNPGSNVWVGTTGAVILVYYALVDWRIATAGIFSGFSVALVLVGMVPPQHLFEGESAARIVNGQILVDLPMTAFAIWMGIVLAVSSANARATALQHAMLTMGVMAHELRSPLTALEFNAFDMRRYADHYLAPRGSEVESATGPMELSAAELHATSMQRLKAWSAELETVARQMHGRVNAQMSSMSGARKLPASPLQMTRLVHAAVAAYPFQSERHGRAVVIECETDFVLMAAEEPMTQVLHNLMSNAFKSLARRSAPARLQRGDVQITIGFRQGMGVLAVEDRGAGIPPALLPRLFEPFVSSDTGAAHGLGLFFCAETVRHVGGRIRARNRDGGGARFEMRFSRKNSTKAPVDAPSASQWDRTFAQSGSDRAAAMPRTSEDVHV